MSDKEENSICRPYMLDGFCSKKDCNFIHPNSSQVSCPEFLLGWELKPRNEIVTGEKRKDVSVKESFETSKFMKKN